MLDKDPLLNFIKPNKLFNLFSFKPTITPNKVDQILLSSYKKYLKFFI